MSENVALLKRLQQIAAQPCSCDERISEALRLLHAYTGRLYARTNIGPSNRLPTSVKSFADQTLVDLRRSIFAAEIRAVGPSKNVFTAGRHRVDMERRVLAIRALEDDGLAPPKGDAVKRPEPARTARSASAAKTENGGGQTTHSDWQVIASLRPRLHEREQVSRSIAAIEESLRLLGGSALVRPLGFSRLSIYGRRRAAFGSFSGQLTM